MPNMQTKVITLGGIVFEGQATAVHARTQSGDVTILDHHQPLISLLAPKSRIRVDTPEGQKAIAVASGFLHMHEDNNLTILVD